MKLFFLTAILASNYCKAQTIFTSNSHYRVETKSEKIVIELHASPGFYKNKRFPNSPPADSVELQSVPFDFIDLHPEWDRNVEKVSNGKIKWTISTEKPVLITSRVLGTGFILSPGDSVRITYNSNIPIISGISANAYKLQLELLKIQGLKGPTKHPLILSSLEDYFAWIRFLDKKTDLILPILDSYKDKVAPFIYEYVKQLNGDWIEVDRTSAFNGLYKLQSDSAINLSFLDLSYIWDSTQSNSTLGQWLRSRSCYYASSYYLYDYNRLDVRRKFNFDYTKDTIKHKKLRVETYYNHAKAKYSGHVLEKLLQYIIAEEIISEVGPAESFTQKVLEDYHRLSNFPEYKDWMKGFVEKKMVLRVGKKVPYFSLVDKNGNEFTKDNLKGKIALLDFWFSGCTGCVQMTPALKKIENIFKNDTNVVFVSISTDKEKEVWEESISVAKYTTGSAINLFTGGNGDNHMIIKQLDISGYPELVFFDADGRIIANPVPDPRNADGMEDLINLIKNESSELTEKRRSIANDGPYILYNSNIMSVHNIENNVLKTNIVNKKTPYIYVKTDQPKLTFDVRLKSHLKTEKSEYAKPQKIIAVSDIEGKFEPFRKLLQNNGIIDANFNWTFGKGHLVICGDVFDRGAQVTECLWLIYNLEEKAKAAGGYVHFILGNHEIMNLQGDHSYAIQKYKDNANKIGKSLVQLYDENSELGKWLRTKNIIEKIGNLLFVHGGIAPELNKLPLSIKQMNNLVRPYYASTNLNTSNEHLHTLLNDKREGGRDKTAPFWFRGYYGDGDNPSHIPSTLQLDSTLQKFGVDRIVTGHTIIADTISVFYNGKVINIDTPHALGKTEALLIEGDSYFRVNKEGRKMPLYVFNTQN